MIKACNRIIEYSFYGLFLLVPLVFTSATSELFELNKMWLTWGLTIAIVTAWIIKMVIQRRIIFQRTPLDIPIGLFLLSQTISTIFSQDVHVSLWGYYSRFNGGLLSIISYIFLYYAFISNFISENSVKIVKRLLFLSLSSGLIVSLWGLPSHFGYDPTCLLFRGTLDVSCWTANFMPKIRIFSTLGQPDWLAAYLAILLPISIIMFVRFAKDLRLSIFYFLLSVLFYIDLLFTRARSGILGIWISLAFFFVAYFWLERKRPKFSILNSQSSIILGIFLITTFIIGTPINQIRMLTLEGIGSVLQKAQVPPQDKKPTKEIEQTSTSSLESGGTESADIRLTVWTGAINAWRANPLFGTGVETFAFAYYKYKPAAHNLTSEWNFLYNKAHNEYLNYLATTGLFGLGTYLSMIVAFLWIAFTKITNSFANFANKLASVHEEKESKFPQNNMLILALLSGYISILVTNFFGFSVVIVNIYLFIIPAIVFVLGKMINLEKQFVFSHESGVRNSQSATAKTSLSQWAFIFSIILASLFMLSNLLRFWQADIAYALGYNLDRAGDYQEGYKHLHTAVELRGDEPVFKDELSINNAIIATALIAHKNETQQQAKSVASALTREAINTSNEIISQYANNVVFWKTRVRLFHTLSQVDPRYLPRALDAIEKASLIAPQDANIWYNLGVIYGQNNNIPKGIEALEKTIKLKPDYRDAHYALGLFYHAASQDTKAIVQMQYILDHISPQDTGAVESIKNWK